MPDNIDRQQLRSWIGRQQRASDTITPALLQRFQATLDGYIPPGASRNSRVPPGIHWCLAVPAAPHHELGADGHPAKGGFLPPVPLPLRMWTSSRIRFHRQPRVGTPIARTSTIADVELKHSAASGPLVFVHIDHVYEQTCGDSTVPLIADRQTIVYRQPAPYQQPAPAARPMAAPALTVVPDSTLLFRYSALTFNGHRIHYDHSYATREEGYPGLVVQGPLMATLLLQLAQAARPDHRLLTFEFRAMAPAFVDQALLLGLQAGAEDAGEKTTQDMTPRRADDSVCLEIRNPAGALVMTAAAHLSAHTDAPQA